MKSRKKYFSFFRLQFNMELQYRVAAVSGVITQILWGFMECLAFRAFQESDPSAYPMAFSATVSYIWLREAFLSAFTTWNADGDIFDSIMNGGIAYELCRPVSIYNMWFSKTSAGRIARAGPGQFLLFVITLFLGLGVTVAFCMFTYILAFFTISPQGLRMIFTSMVDFLSGAIMPLPFMPEGVRRIVELLPFAGMFDVPLRIYSGDLTGMDMFHGIGLQCFWLIVLVIFGKALCRAAERRLVIQGG